MNGLHRFPAADCGRRGARRRNGRHCGGRLLLALTALPINSFISSASVAQPAPPETERPGPVSSHPDRPFWPDEIVVTARRGEALVAAETELGEPEIGSYGAGTIGELVGRIAPLTGRANEQPVILINGERVDSSGGIFGFPPEALERLAILPPEAAGRYGYPDQRRVVNLVLKRHFVSWQAEAGVTVPTAGGKHGRRLSAGRFVIDGKSRWNVQGQITRETSLRKSERSDGGDADEPYPGTPDPDAYQTLLPASRTAVLNAGVTRPLGRFSGSFNLTASRNDGWQLLGLVAFPDGNRVLRGERSSTNLTLSTTISGRVAGWHTNFVARYSHFRAAGALERRAFPIDPQRPVSEAAIVTDRTRGRGENLTAQFNASKSVLSLPAGAVTSSLSVNVARSYTANDRIGGWPGESSSTELRRKQGDARLSLVVPLLRGQGPLAMLGEMSLDLAGSVSAASHAPLYSRFDAAMNWTPLPALQIRASAGFAQLVPTDEQLNGPYVEEVRRVYDFAQREIAEAVWVTGGNRDLGRGNLRNYSLRAALRPFSDRPLTLTSEYRRHSATGGVGSFPGLTPAVERVFPERFVRDSSGRLVSVDARPIGIARDISERLDNSLTLMLAPRQKGEGVSAVLAAEPWQLTLSVNHGWLLRSELLTRPGVPAIDRLKGDAAQSRHSLGFQLIAGKAGMGVTLDGSWQDGFRLRDPDAPGGERDYRHRPTTIINLRLFAEPARLLRPAEKPAWLSNLNVTLEVRNLFDAYQRVLLGDGSVPAGYERYEIDPLGRTVQLSVRKRF